MYPVRHHASAELFAVLVYAIGKVSGCHINPAVTFAQAVWAVFGQNGVTLGMGQTHFASGASTPDYVQAALAEAIGTGLLLFAILGIVDGRAPTQLAGLVIGCALIAIILVLAFTYDDLANPRHIQQPIEAAVTHEEAQ